MFHEFFFFPLEPALSLSLLSMNTSVQIVFGPFHFCNFLRFSVLEMVWVAEEHLGSVTKVAFMTFS